MLCLNCRHALVRVTGTRSPEEGPLYVITCVYGDEGIDYDVIDCSHYDPFGHYFDQNMYDFWLKTKKF